MSRAGRGETVLRGIGVAPGVAIGKVWFAPGAHAPVTPVALPKRRIAAERRRFGKAVEDTVSLYRSLKRHRFGNQATASEEVGFLLDAYVQILEGSRLVRGVEERIAADRINAEAAVERQIAEIVARFEATGDPNLLARCADFRDIGDRLIAALDGGTVATPEPAPRGSVVVADELTPADAALLDPRRVRAAVSAAGGREGHAAIMARALRLPAVVGLTGLHELVSPGERVVIDGRDGLLIINPAPSTLARYRTLREKILRKRRSLLSLRRLPAVTRDGVRIDLQANIELLSELDSVQEAGANGIGLLRTEFLYMNRHELPDVDEQYRTLRRAIEMMGGAPVTIRTLDAGSEKAVPGMEPKRAAAAKPAANPALGLRAVRLSLLRPKPFEQQIEAILRASCHGPVRILLPLVTTPDEIRQVKRIMTRVVRRLRRQKVAIADPLPPLGVMIETPGAALSADSLALESDFFAIGTNDLTMYTLAIDRAEERVAHLYDPLHPAVLRLIQFAAEAALRNRIEVSLCGEMAGDPRLAGLLIGLGLDSLSMSPATLPAVKRRIRGLDRVEARKLAHSVMEQHSAERIKELLEAFNGGG